MSQTFRILLRRLVLFFFWFSITNLWNKINKLLSIFLEQWMTKNTFWVIFSRLVESIHVQLSDEGVYFVMAEIFGQNNLLELIDVLDDEFSACGAPVNDSWELLILNKTTCTFRISKVFAINPATSFVSWLISWLASILGCKFLKN